MTDIVMPRLSDSMESGLVLRWLIDDGEPVDAGDGLVEIETDKATMIHDADAAGTLHIVVPAGTTVAVGEVIAQVGPAAEAVTVADGAKAALDGNGEGPRPDAPVAATPLARRLALAHGVELEELRGTGPRGRITKTDVLRATGLQAASPRLPPALVPAPAPAAAAVPVRLPADGSGNGYSCVQKLTRMQELIARRMSEAKATVPHFQVQTEVTMDEALALRAQLKAVASESDLPPSVNDLIVKAAATALTRHPLANGSYREGAFQLHEHVNVGVAVAAEGALVVPTVMDADRKSLGQIARDTRHLAERVRSGEITAAELSGATFTVSNLGMFGMTAITPVINPPQAAILGVGAARPTLQRSDDGEIVDRTLLTLTLSCDHRILYGADASRFLAEIRALLEAPLRLVL